MRRMPLKPCSEGPSSAKLPERKSDRALLLRNRRGKSVSPRPEERQPLAVAFRTAGATLVA
jgi:hypothetical protein